MKTPHFFEIGWNIIKDTPQFLNLHNLMFKNVLILGDTKTFKIGGNKIATLLRKSGAGVVKKYIVRSDDSTVSEVKKTIQQKNPDLVIGFGGGKVLDVAKLAAGETGIKFISIPTILSNDGIASPISVITNGKGIPVSHRTCPPYGIIVDLEIIKKAPIRHLKAGVGDLISNLSSVFDCRLAQKRNKEKIDPGILNLAEVGAKRILNCPTKNIKSKIFLTELIDGLIKSGLAMCLAGSSRPASGSEHKLSHSFDYLFPERKSLHGEQVGIFSLFTMALQKNSYLKKVERLYQKIRFPQKLSYLGICLKDFVRILKKTRKFRPRRYTILDERNLSERTIKSIVRKVKI
uniref:Iron-containing alcohol dehydrogenase n=1 Tax=candidate division WOR-3 bacterium TaxID=2052148 RepID=A0A7C4TD63_UNCW3